MWFSDLSANLFAPIGAPFALYTSHHVINVFKPTALYWPYIKSADKNPHIIKCWNGNTRNSSFSELQAINPHNNPVGQGRCSLHLTACTSPFRRQSRALANEPHKHSAAGNLPLACQKRHIASAIRSREMAGSGLKLYLQSGTASSTALWPHHFSDVLLGNTDPHSLLLLLLTVRPESVDAQFDTVWYHQCLYRAFIHCSREYCF